MNPPLCEQRLFRGSAGSRLGLANNLDNFRVDLFEAERDLRTISA